MSNLFLTAMFCVLNELYIKKTITKYNYCWLNNKRKYIYKKFHRWCIKICFYHAAGAPVVAWKELEKGL